MEQNPLSEQLKINTAREEMKNKLVSLFDDQEELGLRIDELIQRLESYQRGGIAFDKEKITQELRESRNIKDKQTFVSHISKVLEPFIIAQATQPGIFERIDRDETMNNPVNIRLSEVLYADISDGEAHIHLAHAKDFMTKERIEDFKTEVRNGLVELAKIVKLDIKIKKIWAISWIAASSPKRLEELGFTVTGLISEKEKQEHFLKEDRPVAKAFMTREDLLVRYGN